MGNSFRVRVAIGGPPRLFHFRMLGEGGLTLRGPVVPRLPSFLSPLAPSLLARAAPCGRFLERRHPGSREGTSWVRLVSRPPFPKNPDSVETKNCYQKAMLPIRVAVHGDRGIKSTTEWS
jgi:hypothetical protein